MRRLVFELLEISVVLRFVSHFSSVQCVDARFLVSATYPTDTDADTVQYGIFALGEAWSD